MGTNIERDRALLSGSPGTHDIPWNYGRYRVVVSRRVSDEEQVSVECYEPTVDDAIATYSRVVKSMYDHMVEYNERVQSVHKQQIRLLDQELDLKAQKLHNLEERIGLFEAHQDVAKDGGADALD
jgi:hypothetical protein